MLESSGLSPVELQWAAKRQRLRALLKATPRLDRALARDFREAAAAALIVTQRLGFLSTDLCAGLVRVTPKRVYFGSLAKGAEVFCDDPLVVDAIKFHLRSKSWQISLFGVSRTEVVAYLQRHAGAGFTLKDVRIAWASGYAKVLVDRLGPRPTQAKVQSAARKPERVDVAAIRRALHGLLKSNRQKYDLKVGADGLAILKPEPDDPEDAW